MREECKTDNEAESSLEGAGAFPELTEAVLEVGEGRGLG